MTQIKNEKTKPKNKGGKHRKRCGVCSKTVGRSLRLSPNPLNWVGVYLSINTQ